MHIELENNHKFRTRDREYGFQGYALNFKTEGRHHRIKIELFPRSRDRRSILDESRLIDRLSRAGCVTAPQLVGRGIVDADTLTKVLSGILHETGFDREKPSFDFFAYTYPNGNSSYSQKPLNLTDVALALLEQKSMAVLSTALHPGNVIHDPATNIPVFQHFTQAIDLNPKQCAMDSEAYLHWAHEECMRRFGRKPKENGLFGFFPGRDRRDLSDLFRNGDLDITGSKILARLRSNIEGRTGYKVTTLSVLLDEVSSALRSATDRGDMHVADPVTNPIYNPILRLLASISPDPGALLLGREDIALGCTARQSSRSRFSAPNDPDRAVSYELHEDFAFHTDAEASPWWEVDLASDQPVGRIEVENRVQACRDRAKDLVFRFEKEDGAWVSVDSREIEGFSTDMMSGKASLVLDAPIVARRIRLTVPRKASLHLRRVRVFDR